ncbi:MAG: aminoacyl-tRNA hydrolase [Bacillales bacterium]|jgi:PTH1 family peptidyl-tRNA hydrolase|nr:aminoacyl-tRNA hydrolase [Bacillales bacterium]
MKLIIGLGNFGPEYRDTRHNIGFSVIEELSEKWNIPLNQTKFRGQYGTGIVNGEKIVLVKPLTYMNASGECIAQFVNFYKISNQDLLIIYDDLDLPTGKIRLRQKGSAGGHNGIKSSIMHLGSDQFNRIKVGIGRPDGRIPVVDFVLTRFTENENPFIDEAIEKAANACEYWLKNEFINVMNLYNGK